MNILCINSSEKQAILGIIKDNKKIIGILDSSLSHSEHLLVELESFLNKNNLTLKDFDALSVNVGPGSFTGIRISLSFIKAFNIKNEFKIISVNNFEVLNDNIKENLNEYFVVLSSNNADFYYAKFENENISYGYSNIEDFNNFINNKNCKVFCNEINFEEFKNLKNIVSIKVEPINYLNATLNKANKNNFTTNSISPLYIKKSQAEQTLQNKIDENLIICEETKLEELEGLERLCFTSESYSKEILLQDLNNQNRKQYYAYLFNELIGYINFEVVMDEINLFKICVKQEFRQYYIGSKLMDKMIKFAIQNNIKKIYLEVSSYNYSAIKLYEKFNFKQISLRKNYYKNGDDALIYCLQI